MTQQAILSSSLSMKNIPRIQPFQSFLLFQTSFSKKSEITNGLYRGEKKDVEIDRGLNFYS